LADFNNGWNKFSTDEDEGFRIKKTLVTQFFSELNWRKLNFPEKGRIEYIKKYVTDLKLYFDNDDFVYYHDVIYKLIYKQMGSQIDRNNKENYLIFKKEKELQKKIKKLINDYIIKKNGKNKENLILKLFNPLTEHLYYKLSFQYMKIFINFYKENSEMLQHLGESNIQSLNLFNSSSENSENSEESDNSNSNSSNSNSKDNESKSKSKSDNDSNKNSSSNKEEDSSLKSNENKDNKSKSNNNSSNNNYIKFVNNSSSSFKNSSEEVKETIINNNENQKQDQNQKNENENEVKKE
jgi:hypothetical protein